MADPPPAPSGPPAAAVPIPNSLVPPPFRRHRSIPLPLPPPPVGRRGRPPPVPPGSPPFRPREVTPGSRAPGLGPGPLGPGPGPGTLALVLGPLPQAPGTQAPSPWPRIEFFQQSTPGMHCLSCTAHRALLSAHHALLIMHCSLLLIMHWTHLRIYQRRPTEKPTDSYNDISKTKTAALKFQQSTPAAMHCLS